MRLQPTPRFPDRIAVADAVECNHAFTDCGGCPGYPPQFGLDVAQQFVDPHLAAGLFVHLLDDDRTVETVFPIL